jgi:hypothetical protein
MDTKPTDVQQLRDRATMALAQLQAIEGWTHVCTVLKENIKLIEEMIFNDEGLTPEGEKILKLKRTYLLKLIEIPGNLIKYYQRTPFDDKQFDPYD